MQSVGYPVFLIKLIILFASMNYLLIILHVTLVMQVKGKIRRFILHHLRFDRKELNKSTKEN